MSDELDHNRRIAGWAHAHPAKTATVADVLALRANVQANVDALAKKVSTQHNDDCSKLWDKIKDTRQRLTAVEQADLIARVGRLEAAAGELLVAVTNLELRERERTWRARLEAVRMLGWRAVWRVKAWRVQRGRG